MTSLDAYRVWMHTGEDDLTPGVRRSHFANFQEARVGVAAGRGIEPYLHYIGDLLLAPRPDRGMYIPRLWIEFLEEFAEEHPDAMAALVNRWVDGIHGQRDPFRKARETVALVQTSFGTRHPDDAADLMARAGRAVLRALPEHRILDTLFVHPASRIGTWRASVRPDAFAAASGFVYGAQKTAYGARGEEIDSYLLGALQKINPSLVDGYVTGYLLLHTCHSPRVPIARKQAAIDRALEASCALPADGSGTPVVRDFAVQALLATKDWDRAFSLTTGTGDLAYMDMRIVYLIEYALRYDTSKLDELRRWREGQGYPLDDAFLMVATQLTGEGTLAMDHPEVLKALEEGEGDFNLSTLALLSRKHPDAAFAGVVRERIGICIDALAQGSDPDVRKHTARLLAKALVYLNGPLRTTSRYMASRKQQ